MTGSCAFVMDLAAPKPAPPKPAVPKVAVTKVAVTKVPMKVSTSKPPVTVGPKVTSTSTRHHPRGNWFDDEDEGGLTQISSVSCGALVVVAVVVAAILMMIRK